MAIAKKLGASTLADPNLTGPQGAQTDASQQNAQTQSLAAQQPREGSSGQTPAEKLLQFSTAFPMPAPAPQAVPEVDVQPQPQAMAPEDVAASVFGASGAGYGGPMPMSAGMNPEGPITKLPGDDQGTLPAPTTAPPATRTPTLVSLPRAPTSRSSTPAPTKFVTARTSCRSKRDP